MAMQKYNEMDSHSRSALLEKLRADYAGAKAAGHKLDMSRGKPGRDQLDLSEKLLTVVSSSRDAITENGIDTRNYLPTDGIAEAKKLLGDIMGTDPDLVFVGGNSSLNLMHDCLTFAYIHGLPGFAPWGSGKVKFLCPAPGYDRHFAMTAHFGFELITVPMTPTGPDMDIVEELIKDPEVKGIWCVPKYSNPQGITYSDDTVRRFAALCPAAGDFRIFWDNAYAVHDLDPANPDKLLSLSGELSKNGKGDMAFFFCSTSKITFAGGGICAVSMGKDDFIWLKKHKALQTVGYDKINMLRHAKFLPDSAALTAHMEKHAQLLRPKFRAVLDALAPLKEEGIAAWNEPRGGYFISLDVLPGCAKRVIELCAGAGLTLTNAGAAFPYGKDPEDKNIRIAPTMPPIDELVRAMGLVCLCVRIASLEKL